MHVDIRYHINIVGKRWFSIDTHKSSLKKIGDYTCMHSLATTTLSCLSCLKYALLLREFTLDVQFDDRVVHLQDF